MIVSIEEMLRVCIAYCSKKKRCYKVHNTLQFQTQIVTSYLQIIFIHSRLFTSTFIILVQTWQIAQNTKTTTTYEKKIQWRWFLRKGNNGCIFLTTAVKDKGWHCSLDLHSHYSKEGNYLAMHLQGHCIVSTNNRVDRKEGDNYFSLCFVI